MEVLVFGNSLVEADGLAWKVAQELMGTIAGVSFRKVEMLTDLVGCCSDSRLPKSAWAVLDVAEGLGKVEVIKNTAHLKRTKAVSAHDLDLAFELKLLKKLGEVDEIRVIAVPKKYPLGKAAEEVGKKIALILAEK